MSGTGVPSSIPKLDATGMNWAIFCVRFQDAVEAKGFWDHFDGSSPRPGAADDAKPTAEEKAAHKLWDKDEMSAKSLLTQKIPDSTLMRVHGKPTVHARWEAIKKEYTEKGAYAQTDMRVRFLDMRCPDKANVHEFLDSLCVKREELASVGVKIDEKDYQSTILSSLPSALANFASIQLAAARMYALTQTIDPDILISLISEEFERQKNQHASSARCSGGKSKNDGDEAMSVTGGSSKGKSSGGKGSANWRSRITCWNCGEKGHFKDKCPKPPKDNDGKGKGKDKDTKPSGSANAVVDDSDSDIAFAVSCETKDESDDGRESTSATSIHPPSSHASMPDLFQVSDTESDAGHEADVDDDDEDGWFSEVASDAGDYADNAWDADEDGEPLVVAEPPVEDAFVASPHERAADTAPRVEILDSGTTRHISPYSNDFDTLTDIPPKPLRAANQGSFSAVGMGELVIDVPNGVEASQLRLTEVLYSPEVGYTLVSIGRLDDMGFTSTFGGGRCVIRAPDGARVGVIPKNSKGLYRIEHELDSANAVGEKISIDQLHRRLGHISPAVAKRLISNNLVSGVRFEETSSGDPFFCESCVYAKATRRPVPKQREGDRATEFGGEIHSDLWGPAPVESKGGKRYYVTYTDDKTRLTNIYFLAKKSGAFDSYKDYEAWCGTQLDAKIKCLHSDKGGKYEGREFILHLNSRGTTQKRTVHDTPQQNGVAERRNRVIVEHIRALLHASGLPRFLWAEAARHVVWLMNRTSTKAVDGQTPYEAAFGKKPDLRDVREWGEKVWVRVEGGDKLGGRVREG
jgi:hypothetical protein